MKIRKIEQGTVPSTSRVFTEFNESKIDTYSCNTINTMLNSLESNDPLPVGTILDFDGDEIPEGYGLVEDGSLNTYSTEEQIIGTWINDKPLYRKTFYFENFALQSDVITSTGISDIEKAVNIYGCTYNGTYSVPINFYNAPLGAAYNHYAFFRYSDSAIWFNFYWGTEAYITLEYTKTTD